MGYKRFNASENDDYNTNDVLPEGTLIWNSSSGLIVHDGSTTGGVSAGLSRVRIQDYSSGNMTISPTISQSDGFRTNSVYFPGNGQPGSTELTGLVDVQIIANYNIGYDYKTFTFDSTGNLTLPTNTSVIKYANGTNILDGLGGGSSYANANVANYLPTHTGNVSANYFLGNGSQLTDITVSTATTAATVTTNSQPNITSVGTLSGLTVGPNSSVVLSGTAGYLKANSLQGTDGTQTVYLHYANVAGAAGINTDLTVGTGGTGNITANGTISASGNVTGSYFIGNGSQLTDITASSATTAGTVTTAAQPNITSVGILSSLSVTGNITGNGAGLTNVTVNAAGNIIGTQSNVTLVAGSYSYTFDNTGILTLPAPASGDEGGEIDFTKAASSSLSGSVVIIDQYVDRIRFFEGGGTARGAYIDLTLAAEGVGTLLNNRASGFVNAGVDVTLGNLKARIPSSGNRSIQVSTVTGTYSVYGSAQFTAGGTIGGTNIISGFAVSVTTTPTYLQSGNSFNTAGDAGQWIIMDPSAGLAWRISFIIGASFNNNMISIERLV